MESYHRDEQPVIRQVIQTGHVHMTTQNMGLRAFIVIDVDILLLRNSEKCLIVQKSVVRKL